MGEIFNMDNGFFRLMSKLVDCMFLSLLWVVCCIPVFTIGAATTALYDTAHKTIHENRGYVFQQFKDSLKQNFKQATKVWLIILALAVFLGTDLWLTWQMKSVGDNVGMIFYFLIVLMVILSIIFFYIFPYISRFEDSVKVTFRNAAFMAFGNPLKTILVLITVAVSGFLVYLFPVFLFLMPALCALGEEQIMERIFIRFMPQEETEETHAEEEPVDGRKKKGGWKTAWKSKK